MRYYIKGDCHGDFSWIDKVDLEPSETAFIILGDAGINFYLNKTDKRLKKALQASGFTFYIVRGNHEQRPELISNMLFVEISEINNCVYLEKEYPNIRYLMDGGQYNFNGHWTLVIGGAYSVDKWYRLRKAGLKSDDVDEKTLVKTRWFPHEQLTETERKHITNSVITYDAYGTVAQEFDFILTHTCPYSWMPTDLFLPIVDQSTVDNSMEKWLETLKNTLFWKIWCFGHFHTDRIERPHVEQFYHDYEDMEDIWNRWYGDRTIKRDWWLVKSPRYYFVGETPFDDELEGK